MMWGVDVLGFALGRVCTAVNAVTGVVGVKIFAEAPPARTEVKDERPEAMFEDEAELVDANEVYQAFSTTPLAAVEQLPVIADNAPIVTPPAIATATPLPAAPVVDAVLPTHAEPAVVPPAMRILPTAPVHSVSLVNALAAAAPATPVASSPAPALAPVPDPVACTTTPFMAPTSSVTTPVTTPARPPKPAAPTPRPSASNTPTATTAAASPSARTEPGTPATPSTPLVPSSPAALSPAVACGNTVAESPSEVRVMVEPRVGAGAIRALAAQFGKQAPATPQVPKKEVTAARSSRVGETQAEREARWSANRVQAEAAKQAADAAARAAAEAGRAEITALNAALKRSGADSERRGL